MEGRFRGWILIFFMLKNSWKYVIWERFYLIVLEERGLGWLVVGGFCLRVYFFIYRGGDSY